MTLKGKIRRHPEAFSGPHEGKHNKTWGEKLGGDRSESKDERDDKGEEKPGHQRGEVHGVVCAKKAKLGPIVIASKREKKEKLFLGSRESRDTRRKLEMPGKPEKNERGENLMGML